MVEKIDEPAPVETRDYLIITDGLYLIVIINNAGERLQTKPVEFIYTLFDERVSSDELKQMKNHVVEAIRINLAWPNFPFDEGS